MVSWNCGVVGGKFTEGEDDVSESMSSSVRALMVAMCAIVGKWFLAYQCFFLEGRRTPTRLGDATSLRAAQFLTTPNINIQLLLALINERCLPFGRFYEYPYNLNYGMDPTKV